MCIFRALPVMFAVTLDLRIFANNVSVLILVLWSSALKNMLLIKVIHLIFEKSLKHLWNILLRLSSSCRRKAKVSLERCLRRQRSSWWAVLECVPVTSEEHTQPHTHFLLVIICLAYHIVLWVEYVGFCTQQLL